ncbi:MAG TPA: DUF4189 domain-containing protein [Rhizomicrobium sp.]|nr:DUF4189 domain-containing protein [Rhizomicrobium sp.]
MRRNRKIQISLLLTVVALATLTGSKIMATPQPGPYGAIAMSDTALAYGSSWGYADPISAYERSIAECNKASGGGDCVVKLSLKNNCGVLAISAERNASFLVQGQDQVLATSTAMAQCRATGASDCAIRQSICSSAS